tara:strand:- start:1126 stop:1371 length:246 start_codon:yes stop_codon:yes gene_type:complete
MENRRYFRRHPKTIARFLIIIFSILLVCGVGIGIGGGFITTLYSGESLQFWIGILMVMVSIFVVFWTVLGLIFNVVDYNNS